jgi:uncharacterized membrane protein YdjX (TVP38/TMEM64 family)
LNVKPTTDAPSTPPEPASAPLPVTTTPAAPSQLPKDLAARLGPVGILGILWVALPPLCSIPLFYYMPQISEWLKGHESSGWWIYTGAFAVLAGFAFLPTYAQSALGGYAFGTAYGIPAALLGFGGASLIGYATASMVSGDRVEKIIEEKPRWKAIREALLGRAPSDSRGILPPTERPGFWRTTALVALIRMPPNSPFALTNLVMASVKVPLPCFVLGTVAGMAPRTALAVFLGSLVQGKLTKASLEDAAPGWVWWTGLVVSVLAVLLVAGIISHVAKRALSKVTGI